MFMTLQGEAIYAGMPAFFVRLAKCNLACTFCDTFFDAGDWYTIDELETAINKSITEFYNGNVPYWARYDCIDNSSDVFKKRQIVLVVTGGEPMLQDNLVPFLDQMSHTFEWLQIESNGTQYQPLSDHTTLVISPKCAEKNGKPTKYLMPNEKVLERADCLKFVMSADPDSPYNSVPEWALDWRADTEQQIYVSPMNIYNREPEKSKALRSIKNDITIDERSKVDEVISFWEEGLLDMKANQANHEYTAKYCVQHGTTLSLQTHLYASLA
jgi:7-carboxy-7-deazaguanine synthase